jgi:hypothetical protein
MKRKRKRIRPVELLAAALADKLADHERIQLRRDRVPAEQIIRMFTADHITLWCWGGEDKWWNLDMRRRGPELKAKDASDTSRAAKVVRVSSAWREFTRRMTSTADLGRVGPHKRKWPSRPFPKRKKKNALAR